MISNEFKEVDFAKWCKFCKHEGLSETNIPCCYCSEEQSRLFSDKPLRFEVKGNLKLINFRKYCRTCKFNFDEDICGGCKENVARVSDRPIFWRDKNAE